MYIGRMILLSVFLGTVCAADFPYIMPTNKPAIPLSEAMARAYDNYEAPTYHWNELFTKFRYTPLVGFDYSNGDGTVTRRDPSKVVKANGKYYVWYTHRHTAVPPQGASGATDTIPSTDWDLAEIWYATSEDGFKWQEQGVAVPRPAEPNVGWRSVSTPDVLFWNGKYYLYYQGFNAASGTTEGGDSAPVTVSWADSPDGPWTPTHQLVIPNGPEGSWDQYSIHDPYPLVYNGQIYLYYKSDFNGSQTIRAQGLATADDPLGPFTKCPLNPVLNSGHETGLFPFRGGIASLASRHGNEHNTIQWSPDGINFRIASTVSLMPPAPGPYVPDAFDDTTNGVGITWGLCHFAFEGTQTNKHTIMGRFDCDLTWTDNDPTLRDPEYYWPSEYYFNTGISSGAKDAYTQQAREDLGLPFYLLADNFNPRDGVIYPYRDQVGQGGASEGSIFFNPDGPNNGNIPTTLTLSPHRTDVKWTGLDLEGVGGAEDVIYFSLQAVGSTDGFSTLTSIRADAVGWGVGQDRFNDVGESMMFEVTDVSLSSNTAGSIEFGGFTGARMLKAYAGSTFTGTVNGVAFAFNAADPAWGTTRGADFDATNSVTFETLSRDTTTASCRDFDLQFAYTAAPVQRTAFESWMDEYGVLGNRAAALADPDKDNKSNIYEFGLGGDPIDPQVSGSNVASRVATEGGTPRLEYIHVVRTNALDEIVYRLEETDNLVSNVWKTAEGTFVVGTNHPPTGMAWFTNSVPVDDEQKYIRLTVEPK